MQKPSIRQLEIQNQGSVSLSKVLDYAKRAGKKIRREGVYNSCMQAFLRFESARFDRRYNVDTHSIIKLADLDISNDSVGHGRQYQPILVNHLTKIMDAINPTPNDVLVDFGSGKGRVLLVSSTYPLRKVVGVEFSERLCEIAELNIKNFNGPKQCPIEVYCVDAGEYQIKKEETIFYFFNPFDRVVMQNVMENIKASLSEYPRKITLVCLNLRSENLESVSSEFKLLTQDKLHGISLRIYEFNPA